jgi:hypothetical protein
MSVFAYDSIKDSLQLIAGKVNNGSTSVGGTDNFNNLQNIPTINGTALRGEISNNILELIEPLNEEQNNNLLNIISDDEED